MSPKRWILLGAGAGVAALVAGVAVWHAQGPSKAHGEVAAQAAPSPVRRPLSWDKDGPIVYDVDALLADGSPEAWGRIASLYPSLDEEKKRRVIEKIGHVPELDRTLAYLLATVGEDPRPASADPLVAEAAAALRSRFKKPEDFDFTRRTMVMQQTDKRRWLLANALVDFAKGLPENSSFYPLKGALEAKLIDMHSEVHDTYVKNAIVDSVRALGSRDAALILAKGTDVRDDELEAARNEKATVDAVLQNSAAR